MALRVNQEVYGKHGKGVIANIITKSTGYVLVRYDNGKSVKEMAFNLTDAEGNALRKKPVERTIEARPVTAADKREMYIARLMMSGVSADRFDTKDRLYFSKISAKAQTVGDNFVNSVLATIYRPLNVFYCSARQAAVLADFCIRYGVEL